MTATAAIHPAHAAAREAKAQRLAAHLRRAGLDDPTVIAWLPPARLDAIAAAAGETRTPSMDTWKVVLDILATPADAGQTPGAF